VRFAKARRKMKSGSDDDGIPSVPEIPPDLRVAATIGRLIPFIGAGVSKVAGCPNWDELADGAMRSLADRGKISFAHLEQTRSLSPRVKLSLAQSIASEHKTEINFRTLLHRSDWKLHENGRRIYSALSAMSKSFVTTNYDEWLDEEIGLSSATIHADQSPTKDFLPQSRVVFQKPEELTISNLNRPGSVLHLHGSLKDQDAMIMTTPQYLRRYAYQNARANQRSENSVLTFLGELFKLKTVLFVGYGMADLEILEYIILKRGPSDRQDPQPKHFILQGFFSHERDLMVGMRTYFREFGVELIPYSRDQRDWEQLVDVLESFASKMPAAAIAVSQELADMESLLNE
jgi:hypothetical protein